MPHIECYLMNTGGIGEGRHYKEINIEHTLGILDSLFRGGLEDWIESPTGLIVPKSIRTVDQVYLHPENLYSKEDFIMKQKELDNIRYETISSYGNKLHPKILEVFQKPSSL